MGERSDLCDAFKCFCGWRGRCGPNIPRIAPGTDYLAIPAAGVDDDRPRWSLLVGLTSFKVPWHNLRLHRFRVAASGRVLGDSDDLLERFLDVRPDAAAAEIFASASAHLSSRGDRLHIICRCWRLKTDGGDGEYSTIPNDIRLGEKYTPLAMNLTDKTLTPLGGDLPVVPGEHSPIAAGGEDWALCVERPFDKRRQRGTTILRMQRLEVVPGAGQRWVVAKKHEFPHDYIKHKIRFGGGILQGYVVIRDKILVALLGAVFFVFDCSDCTWAPVSLSGDIYDYIPFKSRASYVEDDDMIYFIRTGTLLAYKYSPEQRSLSPPIKVATLFPFKEGEGFGYLVHMVDKVLCAVWFGNDLSCACTTGHLLITTLIVKGDWNSGCFTPRDVEILHSTCRRVKISERGGTRKGRLGNFGFLQLYVENADQVDPTSIHPRIGQAAYLGIEDSPNILHCCRMFLRDEEDKADVVLVDCKFPTKTHLYIIAETAYVRRTELIDIQHNTQRTIETNRPKVFFTAVFLVGHLIVGLGHSLQDVWIMKKKKWKRLDTSSGPSSDQTRKIEVSGWAVLNSDTFIVADAKTCDCFMLNLTTGEWNVVKPRLPYRCGLLFGRSFCIGGFIYTPWEGGLAAFELVMVEHFYYLGEPIFFRSWNRMIYGSWRRISLDEEFTRIALIGTDEVSDCIVLSMFHGAPSAPPFRGTKHNVMMATVLVKTQTTGQGTKQPISAEHLRKG
uniref:Uncharacterized protein n=1 Tax=Oryza punctata TaxID=4537 RepID=A0A0E0M8K9_ORYPU